MECQEPRCTNAASKDWSGRKVCPDHYEQYEDEQNRQLQSMRDF